MDTLPITRYSLNAPEKPPGANICIVGGNSHDWDLAAADLLVHEAGGLLTSLVGEPIIYNRFGLVHRALIAAGRSRHSLLIDLVRDD